MTDLTAVTLALLEASDKVPRADDSVQDHALCVAAVLRALVQNVYNEEIVTCGGSSYGLYIEVSDIYSIIDELEGTKYGTYRSELP